MRSSSEFVSEWNYQYNLIILDRHPVYRTGVRAQLGNLPSNYRIFEAADYASSLKQVNPARLDLVIIGPSYRQESMLSLIEKLKTAQKTLPIIVCCSEISRPDFRKLSQAGICGWLDETMDSDELARAVKSVALGGTYFCSNFHTQCHAKNHDHSCTKKDCTLTTRELEVLQMLTLGLSNKQIASRMELSVRTVETHRNNIRRKSNRSTLSELVQLADELGLISIELFH